MRRGAPLALAGLLAGCGGVQSSAARDAVQSGLIGDLFQLFFWTTAAVYLGVMLYLAVAVIRGGRNRKAGAGVQGEPLASEEGGWRLALTVFATLTAVILFVFSLATWFTDRSLARAGSNPALKIEVIGHQWWWEVRYNNQIPSRIVRTANEIHLPLGSTANVRLMSTDVIHSLWIPNLAGKQDLIPGRVSDLELTPRRAGNYRAQCAEFCGMQHAKMALDVTVDSPQDFAAWYEAQLRAPVPPSSGPALAGYAIFQTRQCASCHAVAGTPASGQVAPDLSHVASRRTIAAGTLPTSAASLAAWIADPHQVKPGNNMPKVPLSPSELAAVTAYLETLK